MTLYPDVPFVNGQIYTPDIAYLAYHQVYDDQPEYLGHHPRIPDADLSQAPTALLSRFNAVENGFRVQKTTGLSYTVASGIARKPDGTLVTSPGGAYVAPDNTTTYVYLDADGVISAAATMPVIRCHLATIVASGGDITTVSDPRHPTIRNIQPVGSSIRNFGGVNATDLIISTNTTLDLGLYFCRNFTVQSGVTCTISKFARIIVSGNVVIQGTINITTASVGGRSSYNVGGTPIVLGVNPGAGVGTFGSPYGWGLQNYGSGGHSGAFYTQEGVTTQGFVAAGGGGGGGLLIEAAGTITGTGTIIAKGDNGSQGFSYPSGNAGAGVVGTIYPGQVAGVVGSNGGTGGLISLSSLLGITFSGTLDVRGGNGANTVSNLPTHFIQGGVGASGGYCVLAAPSINITGATLLLTGGTTGNPALGNTTLTAPNTWTGNASTNGLSIDSPGAAFAASAGYWSFTGTGTSTPVYQRFNASNGQLILRNIVPIS